MRVSLFTVFLALPVFAQSDPEAFHVEVTADAWRTGVQGTLQSLGVPIDLRTDLNLANTSTFFGRFVLKPARRHRIIVEGAPYSFDGRNLLSRGITYNGRTYDIQDTIVSHADLTYVFGGYQYDFLSRPQGHLGIEGGGAYLNATGTIQSATTGVSATRNQTLGIPLAGINARVFPIKGKSWISISGDVKGMALGGYGHYVQAEILGGVGARGFTVQAGYMILDADIHESGSSPNAAGIAPTIRGPVFGIQFRR